MTILPYYPNEQLTSPSSPNKHIEQIDPVWSPCKVLTKVPILQFQMQIILSFPPLATSWLLNPTTHLIQSEWVPYSMKLFLPLLQSHTLIVLSEPLLQSKSSPTQVMHLTQSVCPFSITIGTMLLTCQILTVESSEQVAKWTLLNLRS